MNEEQKDLVRKKREGTLTEAEYDRYLELLRSDADFWKELTLNNLIEEVLQDEADQRRWNAVEAALAKNKETNGRSGTLQSSQFWAVAAGLTGLLLGAWWWWTVQQNQPRLLSNQSIEIFTSDSLPNGARAYSEGTLPIGTLPVQWQLNAKQVNKFVFSYCADTLKISVKMVRDTSELGNYRLWFDTSQKRFFVKTPLGNPLPVDSCQTQ